MIEFSIDWSDVLDWVQRAATVPARTPIAIARGLNSFGAKMKAAMLQYLSAVTGLAQADIESTSVFEEATTGRLTWKMDASQALLINSDQWQLRPWHESFSDNSFESSILLDIVTQDGCCDVCLTASAEGPYTAEQINTIAAVYADFVPTGLSWLTAMSRVPTTNLLHPNCRCTTRQTTDMGERQLPFTGDDGTMTMETYDEIGDELAKTVMDELVVEIKDVFKKG